MTHDPLPTSAAVPASRAAICPACNSDKGYLMFGPVFKPRRWYRRRAYWKCTWCGYRYEARS